jgi:hypothetical protein
VVPGFPRQSVGWPQEWKAFSAKRPSLVTGDCKGHRATDKVANANGSHAVTDRPMSQEHPSLLV